MGTFKVNGAIEATGNVTCAKDGARFYVDNATTELWFGLNANGNAWGIYNVGKDAYILKQTDETTNFYGNADTATKLKTARTLTIGSTGKSFDGSANVSWNLSEIGATVSNSWTAGSTSGPTLTTTVNGVASTAVAIPAASFTASGIVTTGAQQFEGQKTFRMPPIIRHDSSRYGYLYFANNAGTTLGYIFSDCGNATNITSHQWKFYSASANSTNDTATTGYYEIYYLPASTDGLTANKSYQIFTSKSYSTMDTHNDDRYLKLTGGTLSGTLKFSNALTKVSSPTVLATFINNTSADGIGYCSTAEITVGYATYASRLNPFSGVTTNDSSWDGAAETASGTATVYKQAFKASGLGTDSGDIVLKLRASKYTSGGTELCMMIDGDYYSMGKRLWRTGDSITGAVWNDYAEYRKSDCEEFGRVLVEKGDDTLTKSTKRLSHFAGISSDTWGFCQGETNMAKTPIAVAGRVLAYTYQDRNNYKPGDCVCAAPDGTVDIMSREEIINWPDRIIGTVSCVPDYEEWGGGDREPVKVDGRIWIKIK